MLTGYASGGMLGVPLAAAVAAAALVGPASRDNDGAIGPGLVGLFALVLVGRFFGNMPSMLACMLLAAPLLAWLPELPGVRRLGATFARSTASGAGRAAGGGGAAAGVPPVREGFDRSRRRRDRNSVDDYFKQFGP